MNSSDVKRLSRLAIRRQKEKAKSIIDGIDKSIQSSRRLADEFARSKMLDAMTETERQAFLEAERRGPR